MTISSDIIHRISAGTFARQLLANYAIGWVAGLVGISIAGIILAFAFSWLWIIAVFFILLILTPSIIGTLYYKYALSRECFINTFPHSIAVDGDNLIVTLYSKSDTDFNEQVKNIADDSLKSLDSPMFDRNDYIKLRDEVFNKNMITNYTISIGCITIYLKDKHKGFLMIPDNAFEQDRDFNLFINWLKDGNN